MKCLMLVRERETVCVCVCPEIQTNPDDNVMFSLSGHSACHLDGAGLIVDVLLCFCLYVSLCRVRN